jgi:hypothetical protein
VENSLPELGWEVWADGLLLCHDGGHFPVR